MKKPKILVVGSMNMDLTISTGIFPASGETVLGSDFSTAGGGKGANQAAQVALVGAEVVMAGAVGQDSFGQQLLSSAGHFGVNTKHVRILPDVPTGTAAILLETAKDRPTRNRIIVVPGANMQIMPEDLAFLQEEIAEYDMVILQLEIPMQINELVARFAYEKGVPVMLNPAPWAPLSRELLSCLTYLSPNEHEISGITGVPIRKNPDGSITDPNDLRKAASLLLEQGVKNVLVTLGGAGAALINREEELYSPCIKTSVKDPTAAGDSFVGSFCTALCAGCSHAEAMLFANHTASLTVSSSGAQPSLPTLEQIIASMREKNAAFDFEKLNPLFLP